MLLASMHNKLQNYNPTVYIFREISTERQIFINWQSQNLASTIILRLYI